MRETKRCETCGAEVEVVGEGITHAYKPVAPEVYQELVKVAEETLRFLRSEYPYASPKDATTWRSIEGVIARALAVRDNLKAALKAVKEGK